MRYIRLGSSDLNVSVVGQGSGQFGTKAWGYDSRFSSEDITSAVHADVEQGINLFDTAETYGAGLAETILGNALKQYRRDDFFVVTKVAPWNLRYDSVMKAANRSLGRLGLGYIDLYLIHYPNPLVRMRETFSALERLVREGKIRFIGTSNFHPIQLRRAQESLAHEEIVANEIEYNVLSRFSERYTIPYCLKNGIGVIAYSPLAGGVLTGQFSPRNPPRDRARAFNFFANRSFLSRMEALLDVLAGLAERERASIAQVALAWIFSHPPCVAIPASLNCEEARQNADASRVHLSGQDLARIEEAAPNVRMTTYFFDHFIIRPTSWTKETLRHLKTGQT